MKKIITIITAFILLVACQHETPTSIPEEGVVEYDVMYSGNIKTNNMMGKMLPTKIKGCYNKDGFKLNTQAGLGMVKISVVATTTDSYLTLCINGDKYITPFSKLFTIEDYQKRNSQVEIKENSEIENIAGWDSKTTTVICQSPIGKIKIETYYAPDERLDKKLKDSPVPNVPGLITAIKVTTIDSNIVVMLNQLYAKDISNEEFARPSMHKETNRSYIDSLIFSNIQNNL